MALTEKQKKYHREWQAKKLKKMLDKGLCRCGRKPKKNYKVCDICLSRIKQNQIKRRNAGKCQCNRPVIAGKKVCAVCLDKASKKYHENKKVGKCRCGNSLLPGESWCSECKHKRFIYNANNLANGKCYCGRQSRQGLTLCQVCADRKKKTTHIVSLYRPSSKEEIEKYGNTTAQEILDQYYALFGYERKVRR